MIRRAGLPRLHGTLAVLLVISCQALAQVVDPGDADDERDRVETTNGRTLRGRVVTPYDPAELLLLQGSKRVRVPRAQVRTTHTVFDDLREFLALRARPIADVSYQWLLVEWAREHDLHEMAQLQAYHVLVLDPQHEKAHTLLEHKRRGDTWFWKRKQKYLTQREWDDYVAEWGHPLTLRSVHFRMRTDAGVRVAVDALMDLERLYVWWFDAFGEPLNLQEVLDPMDFHVWKSAESFPGWTEMRLAYYIPRPYDDIAYSFVRAQGSRPENLLRLGMEHILNRALAVDADPGSRKNRVCAWMELGVGQWAETFFDGPPGKARPTSASISPSDAKMVLEQRRYELKHILHRYVRDSYYAAVTRFNQLDWTYAQLFVTFLMDETKPDATRADFLQYMVLAMREKRGDSSRAFDVAMKRKIETLERPFEEWLRKYAK
ncbi:MAG: hypothetical protein H6834_08385 [Planctomycetes bacterium]|nr:hypothetical protein [Planctomycetota bacterium]